VKLGLITFGLILCAALIGLLSGFTLVAALSAFFLVFGYENLASSGRIMRDSLLRSVRNPLMPQGEVFITRTIKVVPVWTAMIGIGFTILSCVNSLEGYNYFIGALGGALIAHAICARKVFSALAKEGALP
jgi:hypothetical protein